VSQAAFYRDEIVRIAAMIGLARQIIAAGAPVDLEPVGSEIKTLCGAVARLPQNVGGELVNDLLSLTARLDRLGNELAQRRHDVDMVDDGPMPGNQSHS